VQVALLGPAVELVAAVAVVLAEPLVVAQAVARVGLAEGPAGLVEPVVYRVAVRVGLLVA